MAKIVSTHNLRFLLISYLDSSFVVLDRAVQAASSSILGYSFGHFQEVTALSWIKKVGKKKPSYFTELQGVHTADETFVTAAQDMAVYVWKHFGDRWSFSFIDVAKCFDSSLGY